MRIRWMLILSAMLWASACTFAETYAETTTESSAAPTTQSRTADEIIAALNTEPAPQYESARAKEPGYSRSHTLLLNDVLLRRSASIAELYRLEPDSARTRVLLVERWRILGQFRRGKEALPEITAYFAFPLIGPEREDAAYYGALIELNEAKSDAQWNQAISNFEQRSNDKKRLGGVLLFASEKMQDTAEKIKLLQRVVSTAPESTDAALANGKIEQLKNIGKSFDLSFKDVITGNAVNMADFKGKVVVVDFWATWCGPCRKSIPELRTLYTDLHDQGMEMISISLDSAGEENIAKLKEMIAAEKMPWHHYYQGDGFDSAFSKSWGISSIPQLFVIDKQGKLVSTTARNGLRELVKTLLKAE